MSDPYPEQALVAMQVAWSWLETSVHPVAAWACVPLLAFIANLVIRTWLPGLWQSCARLGPVGVKASKAFQALPAVAMGAIIVSLGTDADLKLTVMGALLALAAPVGCLPSLDCCSPSASAHRKSAVPVRSSMRSVTG